MTSRQSTAGGEESNHEESKLQEPKLQEPKLQEPKLQEPNHQEPNHQEPNHQEPNYQESKNGLHHGDRGELAGSNDRGDQYGYQSGGQHGGGHLQHPLPSHPPPTPGSATGYPSTAQHGPLRHPSRLPYNATDYQPTAQFVPPPPPPSWANYPNGQYLPQTASTGQYHWNHGNEPSQPLLSMRLHAPNQTGYPSYNSVNGEEDGMEKNGGRKRKRSQANIDEDPSAGSRGTWDVLRRDLANTLKFVFNRFQEIDEIQGHSTDERANLTVHLTVGRSQTTGEVNVNINRLLNGPSRGTETHLGQHSSY
ncbi:uncharacterized protein FMAN_05483 [Fusarium mangiferae]|uniref:Uncharacterized protein n=1 Tax=Fusarium mangiferae TaxID=192010 RepID=A0A1L7SPD8_FUSMA|nr:uncharacterized protein FMAN_05483 [Fusarium mangiferae]CVK87569.1 uncharacterized protein FMAN_05483 [Fusarium mangiferae]